MKATAIVLIIILTAGAIYAEPLGDTVGSTYWEQHNFGSASNRIAVCDDGSIYVCWMNLCGWPYPPAPRHVYYNWRSPDGVWNPNQFEGQIDRESNAGYCNLDIINGNQGVFGYHNSSGSQPTYVTLAIDAFPGFGFFDYYNPPDEIFPQTPDYPGRCYWPDVAVDRNDNIHITMTENTDWRPMRRLCYTNSTDGGSTWSDVQLVDSVMLVTAIITASPVSDRVAIAFLHPNDTTTQSNNEVYYIVSEDGLNWNWQTDNIQVTDYMNSGSSHHAAFGVEALFDYNDVLHISWPTYNDTVGWLWHYDELSDSIVLITVNEDTLSPLPNWRAPIEQVSLSRRESPSVLFATWCQYAEGDINSGGAYNGDIFMSQSDDMGLTWQESQNITNTPSPDCLPGNCESEIFPSAAEDADLLPYLTYIYDHYNYYPYITALPVMFVEAEHLTNIEAGKHPRPEQFALSQNYPNPFNAKTTVQYTLPMASDVNIEIYNILGRKIETLLTGKQPAGSHSVIWDADKHSSGIYFYKIKADSFEQTRKMVLLK